MLATTRLLSVLSLLSVALAQVPPAFLGTWHGMPEVTTLGPPQDAMLFHVDKDPSGGWYFHHSMADDFDITGSAQRFYVDNKTYYLTYCGVVLDFFTSGDPSVVSCACAVCGLPASLFGAGRVRCADRCFAVRRMGRCSSRCTPCRRMIRRSCGEWTRTSASVPLHR
jgi:hypothetical protein